MEGISYTLDFTDKFEKSIVAVTIPDYAHFNIVSKIWSRQAKIRKLTFTPQTLLTKGKWILFLVYHPPFTAKFLKDYVATPRAHMKGQLESREYHIIHFHLMWGK